MPDERPERLRKLEAQLGEASENAERLIREAAEAQGAQRATPPSGWATRDEDAPPSPLGSEFEALVGAVRSLRDLVPPEVVQRLAEALKEVLLALRGVIDYYVERLEQRHVDPPQVKDIPIE